jgi:DNA-directed RNA polymerase specialized sigma24 family protein
MTEPRRDHYIAPDTGADTAAAIAAAIKSLAAARNFEDPDATITLHLLASLLAHAQARLPQAVTDARNQGCSWAEIADLLGVTRASAWQRYAPAPEPNTSRHNDTNRPSRTIQQKSRAEFTV